MRIRQRTRLLRLPRAEHAKWRAPFSAISEFHRGPLSRSWFVLHRQSSPLGKRRQGKPEKGSVLIWFVLPLALFDGVVRLANVPYCRIGTEEVITEFSFVPA